MVPICLLSNVQVVHAEWCIDWFFLHVICTCPQLAPIIPSSTRLACRVNCYASWQPIFSRHLCFHNVLSSSLYANVVLPSLLILGSATGQYSLLTLWSFTHKVLA